MLKWLKTIFTRLTPSEVEVNKKEWNELQWWYLSNWWRWEHCSERERILIDHAYTLEELTCQVARDQGNSHLSSKVMTILRQLQKCAKTPA